MGGWTHRPGAGVDVLAALHDGADRAAYLVGQQVLTTSNQRVPHEEGTLEGSGDVSPPQDGRVTVSYDTPYAVRQHEELGYRHERGQAKYLESAMNDTATVGGPIAATAIRAALGT